VHWCLVACLVKSAVSPRLLTRVFLVSIGSVGHVGCDDECRGCMHCLYATRPGTSDSLLDSVPHIVIADAAVLKRVMSCIVSAASGEAVICNCSNSCYLVYADGHTCIRMDLLVCRYACIVV
jgi:hypothetical protein